MKLERIRFNVMLMVVALVLVIGFATIGLTYNQFSWSNLAFAQDALYGDEIGCGIDIPDGSVVGAFVSDTELYWEPASDAGSTVAVGHTPEIPKTAWVIGQDSTNSYYKIIWACEYLWVPKSTMGPNPDDLWQGMALPTTIVE